MVQSLKTTVRDDWQEITQRANAENILIWRVVLILLGSSTLTALLIGLLPLPGPWQDFLRTAVSFSLFCVFALWSIYRSENKARQITLVLGLLFVGSAAIAAFTRPLPAGSGTSPPWPLGLAILIPIFSGFALAWSHRVSPAGTRSLGLIAEGWFVSLIAGAAAGGALGLHLWLTSGVAPNRELFDLPRLIWALCYYIGLQALGEELLFRGLSFPLLSQRLHNGLWTAVAKVVILNLLVYLALVPQSSNMVIGLWIVVYRVALALTALLFRYWHRSLVSCLAANVVFSTLTAMVLM
jgi:hypothetical protein